ncbi:hypothetical protein BSKO_08226 [Bryopsis sp. KO-2023]|nr:hypothetical protein BSKO_08226 [Bryopsis sp. KO-2023]
MSSLMASIEDTIGNLRRDIAATRTINVGPPKPSKRYGNRRGSDTATINNLRHHPIKTTPSLPASLHNSSLRDAVHLGGYSPISETSPQIGAHYQTPIFEVPERSRGYQERDAQPELTLPLEHQPGLQSVMDVMKSTMGEFQRLNSLTNQQALEIQRLQDGLTRIGGQENSILDLQASIEQLMSWSKHQEDLKGNIETLQKEFTESSSSISDLRAVISTVESNMREQREYLTDMKERVEAATEAVSSVGESKQTLDQLTLAIQETTEWSASRQDVEDVLEIVKNQSQKIVALEEELCKRNAASDRVENMEVQIDELAVRFEGFQDLIKSLESRLPDTTLLARRQDEQTLKLRTISSQVAELSDNHVCPGDIQSLMSLIDEVGGCIPRVKELDESLAKIQLKQNDQFKDLEAQVESLKELARSNDVDHVGAQVEQLASSAAILESGQTQMAAKVEAISSDLVSRSEFQALANSVEDILSSTEVESLKAVVNGIQSCQVDPKQIESLVAGLDSLDRRSTANTERIDELATEALSTANSRIDAVSSEVESLVFLKERHKENTEAIQRLEKYNEQCSGKLETLSSGVDRFYAGAEELACLSSDVDCLFTKVEEMSSASGDAKRFSKGLEQIESIRSNQMRVEALTTGHGKTISDLSIQVKELSESQARKGDVEKLSAELSALSNYKSLESLEDIGYRMDQLAACQGENPLQVEDLQESVQKMERSMESFERLQAVQNDQQTTIAAILSKEERNGALLEEQAGALRNLSAEQTAYTNKRFEDSLDDLWCKLDAQGEDIQELKDRGQGDNEIAGVKEELENFVEKVNAEMENFSNQLSDANNRQISLENKEKDIRLGLRSLKSQVRDVDCALEKSLSTKDDQIHKDPDQKTPLPPAHELREHDVESGLQDNPLFEEPQPRPPPTVLPTPAATCIVTCSKNAEVKADSPGCRPKDDGCKGVEPMDSQILKQCELQDCDEIGEHVTRLPSLPTVEEGQESSSSSEDDDCFPSSEACSLLSREDCEGTLEEVLGLTLDTHHSPEEQTAVGNSLGELGRRVKPTMVSHGCCNTKAT